MSEKQLNPILLFVINLGYEDLKIGINHTHGYLIPAHYKLLSHDDENTTIDRVVSNILTTVSEAAVEMLPVMPK